MSIGTIRDLLTTAELEVLAAWKDSQSRDAAGALVPDSKAQEILDRVTQLGVLLIEDRQIETLGLVLKTFTSLYEAVGTNEPPSHYPAPLGVQTDALHWLDVATRVYVLGAVCVLRAEYDPIRDLILQQPKGQRVGRYWLRDTVTALARLQMFKSQSIIPPIVEHIAARSVLFRRFQENKDRAVSALCQFDFLQCLVSVLETNQLMSCYPNFATYFSARTEPIIVDLVAGGPARKVVGNVSNSRLAEAINKIDELASKQAFSFAGWDYHDFRDQRLLDFLRKYS